MEKNPILYKLYLTEEKGTVRYDDGSFDSDPYKGGITIVDVRKALSKYKLKEEKEFEDWYAFINDRLEISVPLKSEANFDDDHEKTTQDLNIYITLVNLVFFLIMKPLYRSDVDIIMNLIEAFNLFLYDVETEKHYSTRDQIISFLQRKRLLA